eukprot:COSAG02_NODE_13272_length_1417_cov_2.339909_1_plen_250_part_00
MHRRLAAATVFQRRSAICINTAPMPPKRDVGSSPGRGGARQHDPYSSTQPAAVVDHPGSSSGAAAADASVEHSQPLQRETQRPVEGSDQRGAEHQPSEELLEGGGEHDDSVPLRSEPEPQHNAVAGVAEPMDHDDDAAGHSEQNGLLGSSSGQDTAASLATATDSESGASLAQTYITFFKSFVGIAILGLPHAFSLAGYVLAPLGFLLVCPGWLLRGGPRAAARARTDRACPTVCLSPIAARALRLDLL